MNALQLNVIAPCACGIRIVTLCNRPGETRPSGFLPFNRRKFSPPRQLVKFLILVGQFVASWRYHFYIRSIYHSFCACLKNGQNSDLTKRSNLLEKSLFSRKPGENIDATGLLQRDVLNDAECPLDVIRSTRRKGDQQETAVQNTLPVKY